MYMIEMTHFGMAIEQFHADRVDRLRCTNYGLSLEIPYKFTLKDSCHRTADLFTATILWSGFEFHAQHPSFFLGVFYRLTLDYLYESKFRSSSTDWCPHCAGQSLNYSALPTQHFLLDMLSAQCRAHSVSGKSF